MWPALLNGVGPTQVHPNLSTICRLQVRLLKSMSSGWSNFNSHEIQQQWNTNVHSINSQVTTVTVIPGPVPALVDAVIVQLYWVAGMNIPTVALRAPSLIPFTGWPLPRLGVQTMSYLVIFPFCWSGGGGCQEKNTISGLSWSYSNMTLCGAASGAVGR